MNTDFHVRVIEQVQEKYPIVDINLPLGIQLDSLSQVEFFIELERILQRSLDPLTFERESCSIAEAIWRVI